MASTRLGSRFWTLWAAATAANLADGLTVVAFPLLAIELVDDARLVALVAVFRYLPFLVIGLPAGVVIDRVDRRLIALGAQLVRASVIVGLAFGVAADAIGITALAVAAFAVGVGEVLTDGGLPAIVRDVVDRDALEVANARLSATQTVSNYFIGPPVAALLFELDAAAPLFVTAALFLVGAVVLSRLPGTYRSTEASPTDENGAASRTAGLRQEVTVGLRYVWGHPVLRPLALAVALFSFVGEAGNAVFVILATERFGLGSVGFGVLIAVDGVASVAVSFLVAGLIARTSHTFSMRVSIVAFTVSAFLFGLTTAVASAVLASMISGVADPTWNVVSGTIRQRLVPDAVFGRMMTAYLFIAWGMQPVGALLGGVIAEAWGPEWVYVVSGTAVGSLLVLGRPLFREIDAAMRPASR